MLYKKTKSKMRSHKKEQNYKFRWFSHLLIIIYFSFPPEICTNFCIVRKRIGSSLGGKIGGKSTKFSFSSDALRLTWKFKNKLKIGKNSLDEPIPRVEWHWVVPDGSETGPIWSSGCRVNCLKISDFDLIFLNFNFFLNFYFNL